MTWLITMALMIPTTVYVHLRLPRLRRLLESITILPIVIPPVVLIVGVLQVMPLALRSSVWLLALEYVILAMPFAYRAIDAGLRAIDIKTLTEASGIARRRLGHHAVAGPAAEPAHRDPARRPILIVALVLGEFTMASLDLQQTFPVVDRAVRPAERADLGRGLDLRPARDLDPPDADHAGRPPASRAAPAAAR